MNFYLLVTFCFVASSSAHSFFWILYVFSLVVSTHWPLNILGTYFGWHLPEMIYPLLIILCIQVNTLLLIFFSNLYCKYFSVVPQLFLIPNVVEHLFLNLFTKNMYSVSITYSPLLPLVRGLSSFINILELFLLYIFIISQFLFPLGN